MEMHDSILTSSCCNVCAFGENGFYNAICAHCPDCVYSKNTESSFITKELAEQLGVIFKETDENGSMA